MKIDKIVLKGSRSITLFDLVNPRSTPYTAKTIDGLDPTEVDVTLAQTSGGTGIYIGQRQQLREITINLGLNPSYENGETPDVLRENVYLMQSVRSDAALEFCLMYQGVEVAWTPVYIKRTEAAAFSKETIMQLVLSSTSGTFERRESISVTDPAFDKRYPVLRNSGSALTGFRMTINFTQTLNAFGLWRAVPVEFLVLGKLESESELFLAGDQLVIDTQIGKRGVWRTRGTTTQSMLGYLTRDSIWLSLLPGDNTLEAVCNPNAPADSLVYKRYEHTPKYRGI